MRAWFSLSAAVVACLFLGGGHASATPLPANQDRGRTKNPEAQRIIKMLGRPSVIMPLANGDVLWQFPFPLKGMRGVVAFFEITPDGRILHPNPVQTPWQYRPPPFAPHEPQDKYHPGSSLLARNA